ncbi:similar to Saccharomyces cerevisiae YNL216W RAP1 DNA-binding protein involved in either activation or repression of transcription, depending on binding site context [Maudiozyma saulgeensis]|uniref:DNA-binding protein RAP1 n=1 Tax=Maudiozyma saulgeensis TaxID=1789683 RepID=A0A1X7R2B1_9SACH|nr:similar to Saccharomyces cerevisiae YNL216W RAP1 DNA-binding protein involved in either activation or repression of transcription, depending on binding site context [Kazachstania saulgeensis]
MSDSTDLAKAAEDFVDQLSGDIVVDPAIAEEGATKENDGEAQESSGQNISSTEEKEQLENDEEDNSKKLPSNKETENTSSEILDGKKFFINRDADAHDSTTDVDKLETLIKENGGELLEKIPEETTDDIIVVSPYNDTKLPTVTPTYIKECIKSGILLDMKNYLVPYDEFRAVIDNQLQTPYNNEDGEIKESQGTSNGINVETTEKSAQSSSTNVNNNNGDDDDDDNIDDELKLFHDAVDNSNSLSQPLVQVENPTSSQQQNNNVGQHNSQNVSSHYMTQDHDIIRANLPSNNKAAFTEDEDEFILDVVRKNPTRRTTHTLFDEISHYVPNHTGNSIRHRYRVYLSKRLEYVYKVDEFGKLIRDDEGNLIKTEVLPPSLKKKFTAKEDYDLAQAVKRQFYRDLFQVDPDTGKSLISSNDTPVAIAKRKVTMDHNNVPGSEPTFDKYRIGARRGPIAREFFKIFGSKNPTHTENAWRDRFRKFLLEYGIDQYISYYDTEMAENRVPEPIRNMTNRPKREGLPTPGNYNSAIKRAKVNVPSVARGASQTLNDNESVSLAAAAAAAADQNTLTNHQRNYPIPESDLLDEETMNFISDLKNNLKNMDNNLPFEYPQEIADAIRHDFSIEEAEFDNIDPDSIPFPPDIASIDLFLPTFFQMASTREFMDKIEDVISRDYEPSQAEKLVQDLCDEAGVRKTFSTSILTALSGDLMVFPRYFLNSFKHNANPPMNVPGIWTREDDEILKGGKEEELALIEKKHGTGRIEMRKRFIEKDLI